ncbi:MAG: hypothetical protein DRN30_02520 [Thermoplasmata archaeon]|nr:MAG: hypothetical protein DRN30_02520 [Thermoplasmata archaeon]
MKIEKMIAVVIEKAERAPEIVRRYHKLGLKVMLSVYGGRMTGNLNCPNEMIDFIGEYISPEEALLEVLEFLETDENILFHIGSEYVLNTADVNQLNALFNLGYSAVFFYYLPYDSVYRNFLYPLIGGCIGRPIPPPTAPFAISNDLYISRKESFLSGNSFYYAYNIFVFMELSTTFEPSAGIFVELEKSLSEESYVQAFSAYLEYFPRWRLFEGEHRIHIVGMYEIKPRKPEREISLSQYASLIEKLITGEYSFDHVREVMGDPMHINEMEYHRKLINENKEEVISVIRRSSKTLF